MTMPSMPLDFIFDEINCEKMRYSWIQAMAVIDLETIKWEEHDLQES
jgi:hypothetical protein